MLFPFYSVTYQKREVYRTNDPSISIMHNIIRQRYLRIQNFHFYGFSSMVLWYFINASPQLNFKSSSFFHMQFFTSEKHHASHHFYWRCYTIESFYLAVVRRTIRHVCLEISISIYDIVYFFLKNYINIFTLANIEENLVYENILWLGQ